MHKIILIMLESQPFQVSSFLLDLISSPLWCFLFQPGTCRLLLSAVSWIGSRGQHSGLSLVVSKWQKDLNCPSRPLCNHSSTSLTSFEPCILNVSSSLYSERINFCELVFYTSIYTSTCFLLPFRITKICRWNHRLLTWPHLICLLDPILQFWI